MIRAFFKFIILFAFLIFYSIPIYSTTIITAPIDGRPISTEYLNKLAQINGDYVLYPDKNILDMFPLNSNYNRFCDSEKVRESIKELVKNNNSSQNTVIINTSSYITSGLVGSRCGINYYNYKQGLDEIYNLVSESPLPKYYVNLSMPRTLPETRLNKIWSDSDLRNGIAYYYLKYNPNCEDKNYITSNLSRINPEQVIMEWSYVENKKNEIGIENISEWEKDFLKNFDKTCRDFYPYKSFLRDYVRPYSDVADIFRILLKWHDEDIIDEIVISNDDFQLPNSIVYFNSKGNSDWIQKENNAPIKYSFARTYVTDGPSSIYKIIKDNMGEEYANLAMQGKAERINFIFGMDEVPQLIYARDLSERTDISADINTIITSNSSDIAKFDVLSVKKLVSNGINFVSAGNTKTNKKFDLYVCDYNNTNISESDLKKQMTGSIIQNRNVALIELFSNEVSASGNNKLFKLLLEDNITKNSNNINLSDISVYSAWNTNANAIGLGIANIQVYAASEQTAGENAENFIKKSKEFLLQHIVEDGIYTVSGKRLLTNERFYPTYDDTIKSEKLLTVLDIDNILKLFKNKTYELNKKSYTIKNSELLEYNFPWGRLFECYLDFNIEISEDKIN